MGRFAPENRCWESETIRSIRSASERNKTIFDYYAHLKFGTLDMNKLARIIYRRVLRKFFADQHILYAGVKHYKKRRPLDEFFLPEESFRYLRDRPNHENSLIFGLKQTVKKADRVINIGAGSGVTAVIASNLVGRSGWLCCTNRMRYGLPLSPDGFSLRAL